MISRVLALVVVMACVVLDGRAEASTFTFANEGDAYAACYAAASSATSYTTGTAPNVQSFMDFASPGAQCTVQGVGATEVTLMCGFRVKWNRDGTYAGFTRGCSGFASGFDFYKFPKNATCSARPPVTGGFTPPNGSIGCNAGCDVVYQYNGDGTSTGSYTGGSCDTNNQPEQCSAMTGYYWHPSLNVCVPATPDDCKPGTAAKEGVCEKPEQCPEGMITDANGLCKRADPECPAGGTRGPDGSCVDDENSCPSGTAKRNDGTCGKDENNDGKADDEDDDPDNDSEKNEFSGGDTCDTPPTCSGDPILCGQARIQWRIECNTRRNVNIAGGGCDAVPVCTGQKCNAMEYAQLLQQWRGSCAMQKLAGTVQNGGINVVGGGGSGGGDGNGNGQPDWTENPGNGEHDTGAEGNPGDAFGEEQEIGADGLDTSGYGWGSSCPAMPTVSIGGQTIAFDTSKFCEWVHLGGVFVLIIAGLVSLRIIGGAV